VNCPHCGARNPGGAPWCTQCYEPLTARPTAAPPLAEPLFPASVPGPDEDAGVSAPQPSVDTDPTVLQAGSGRFRTTVEGLEWSCRLCDSWNPIEVVRCTVCGHALASEPDQGGLKDVPAGRALGASVLLPGLGHVLLGRGGTGVARMIVAVVWLAGGIALSASAAGSDQSVLPGLVLLVGAAVVWVATLLDVQTLLSGGRRELLDSRRLLWLVVGVIGALVAALLVATLSLPG
jgi:hypothetical protein